MNEPIDPLKTMLPLDMQRKPAVRDSAMLTTLAIVAGLCERKGFSQWWFKLEKEEMLEISNGIADEIESSLTNSPDKARLDFLNANEAWEMDGNGRKVFTVHEVKAYPARNNKDLRDAIDEARRRHER